MVSRASYVTGASRSRVCSSEADSHTASAGKPCGNSHFHLGRVGHKVLVRASTAPGAATRRVNYLHARAMSYSVGFTLPQHTPQGPGKVPS
jgi:hypothetical protein